jgi:YbbR domain-containing protein
VKATFWGKGRDLLALILNQKLHYNIDLVNLDGNKLFILNKQNIRLPRKTNIEILNIIHPESVFVKIDELKEKRVPIHPNIEILPMAGYTIVDDVRLESDSISIIGPQTYLDSVSAIETEHVLFKNVKRDINKKIKLVFPKTKYISMTFNELDFHIDIQKLMEKQLVEVPVGTINSPEGYEITVIPSSLSLTLIGGVDVLLSIENTDVSAYIDYRKARYSKNKDHLAYIEKIDGVRFTDIKPKRFKIVVKKKR